MLTDSYIKTVKSELKKMYKGEISVYVFGDDLWVEFWQNRKFVGKYKVKGEGREDRSEQYTRILVRKLLVELGLDILKGYFKLGVDNMPHI